VVDREDNFALIGAVGRVYRYKKSLERKLEAKVRETAMGQKAGESEEQENPVEKD